jgi:hypothetical protein
MGLGPLGAVIVIVAIMATIVLVLVNVCYYHTDRTNKRVLRKMYERVANNTFFDSEESRRMMLPPGKESLEILLEEFKKIFFLMSLEKLKALKIIKLDEDIYNMCQDVDDLRQEVINKKENRKKQTW